MSANEELVELYLELINKYTKQKNYEKAKQYLLNIKQVSPEKEIDETLTELDCLIQQSHNESCSSKEYSNFNTQKNHQNTTKCGKCGFIHQRGKTCPALNVICHKCRKKGHFARVCSNKEQTFNFKKEEKTPSRNECDRCGFWSHPPGKSCPAFNSICLICGVKGHWDRACTSDKENKRNENLKTSDTQSNITTESKKEIANEYVELAKNYISEKNYEKAEEFLLKAKKYSSEEKIDDLLDELSLLKEQSQERKPEYFNFSQDVNKEESVKCVNLAERYMAEKNYEKAEKLLLKAKKMYPVQETDSLLEKLRELIEAKEKAESNNITNRDEANKCLEIAEQCMSEGHYEKAEKFISKAKQLFPSEEANKLSDKLFLLMNQSRARNSDYAKFSSDINKEESEKCLELAEKHMAKKNYEKAEKFLLKAKKLFPTNEVYSLLSKLYSKMFDENQGTKPEKNFNKVEADKCVKLAQDYLTTNKYENLLKAKDLLLKAKDLYSTPNTDALLEEAEKLMAKQRNEEQYKFSNEMNKDEAEKCFRKAEEFISAKNYEKAEQFLLKAKQLCSNAKIIYLLEQVSNILQKQNREEAYFCRKDINKEEADRCIEMSDIYLDQKNYEKARWFLLKAKKLYPMDKIDKALAHLESILKNNAKKEKSSQYQKQYTKEQLDAVNRVLACDKKNCHAILDVNDQSTFEDIKKAYKILALKIHPDKTCAPGAEEAFKRIVNAFKILSSKWNKSEENEKQ